MSINKEITLETALYNWTLETSIISNPNVIIDNRWARIIVNNPQWMSGLFEALDEGDLKIILLLKEITGVTPDIPEEHYGRWRYISNWWLTWWKENSNVKI